MLQHLRIENVALLRGAELDLEAGLTALTGESGAGKTVLLEALGLLLGDRGGAQLLGPTGDRLRVEGEFHLPERCAARDWLSAQGFQDADVPDALVLRRDWSEGGRNRITVNGSLATLGQLAELGRLLVERHRQGAQHALLQPAEQRDLFDAWAGALEIRGKLAKAWGEYDERRARLAEWQAEERQAAQRLDFLRFQIEELEGAELRSGELAELEADVQRLRAAEELRMGTAFLSETLAGEDGGGALRLAGNGLRRIEQLLRRDGALEPVAATLREALVLLDESNRLAVEYLAGLDADGERLPAVEERVQQLRRLLRKYGPTETDALTRLSEMREEMDWLSHRDAQKGDWEREAEHWRREVMVLCTELRAMREQAREGFSVAMVSVLKELAMPGARLEVAMRNAADTGPHGSEEVEFLFSANAGEELHPLRKVASGGELARVMLALRSQFAAADDVPILLFDEVDGGLSGESARRVGERLKLVGERAQVLAVTHQPAVAALADQHLLVEKHRTVTGTEITVRALELGERREELGRLLDGGSASATGKRLAEELLSRAG